MLCPGLSFFALSAGSRIKFSLTLASERYTINFDIGIQTGKEKLQGVPQSQAVAHPRHQEEEETDKTKEAQIEQMYESLDMSVNCITAFVHCISRKVARFYGALVDTLQILSIQTLCTQVKIMEQKARNAQNRKQNVYLVMCICKHEAMGGTFVVFRI